MCFFGVRFGLFGEFFVLSFLNHWLTFWLACVFFSYVVMVKLWTCWFFMVSVCQTAQVLDCSSNPFVAANAFVLVLHIYLLGNVFNTVP